MRGPEIIGICGRARAGKSTVANYIRAHYGAEVMAFADPIKAGLVRMFNIAESFMEDDKELAIPGIGASYRKLAQTLGTEWGRGLIHPDLWVLHMMRRIGLLDGDDRVIIPDVRFPNEATWIRSQGVLVHIVRDELQTVREHISEAGIEPMSGEWVIYNSGSMLDLHSQIDELMGDLTERRNSA
jgi:hypothetical protein